MRLPSIIILPALFLLYTVPSAAQADSIEKRIILIGDAGEMQRGTHPELELIKQLFNFGTTPTTVLYLGDNVYPHGLPDSLSKDFATARAILDDQVGLVKNPSTGSGRADAWFIPGNHDWVQGGKKGWQQIVHQSRYINGLQLSNVHFLPEGGCPGPVEVHLSDNIVLVIMDSQWWLHLNPKPGPQSDCPCKTKDEVITRLNDIVYRNQDKLLLFATHHPMKSYGVHGGYFTLKQHLFPLTDKKPSLYIPLPVVGSIYPISRGIFGNIQDTKHPIYKQMIQEVEEVLNNHPNCIRLAGHDHGLQLIESNGKSYVISGGGSKHTRVKKGKDALFADGATGFAELEVLRSGKTWIKYYSSASAHPQEPLYAGLLPQQVPAKTSTVSVQRPVLPDSMSFPGYPAFRAGPVQRFFLGTNYRAEWQAPVKAQVFDITKQFGGLTPLQRGGGHQTKSLRLADSSGKEYVLRSIQKVPTQDALPEAFRGTFVIDLVKDGVSSSYPYAALSVPPLAAAVGVPHANPKLFYVPDDPAFGIYRKDFANNLYFLEERAPDSDGKTYNTFKVFDKLRDDNDNKIDQQAVLKARLLDMFMMDFDRHEDQWRWVATDNGKGKTFAPIPRDRDQPFFTSSGLIPWVAGRDWVTPQLQGFRAHARNIKTYNFNTRNFDRNFMNGLTLEDWKAAASKTIAAMTDSLIQASLALQPAGVFPYSAHTIAATLKARKNFLLQEMEEYYHFLARTVSVVGSDKKELFDITRNDDGSVIVKMYKINKSGEQAATLYERTFLYHETKEIRLYGMGEDDKFVVHGNARKTIKIRIIGGEGDDAINNEDTHTAPSKTIVYDLVSEKNSFSGPIKKQLSDNPEVNEWNRFDYKYNVAMPFLSFNFNPDDGVYLGASLKYTVQGFRRDPFKLQHQLVVNHALATNAWNFKYGLDVTNAIGKLDLLVRADIRAPNNTINYFGSGNQSVYDKHTSEKILYYRTRFTLADLGVLLRVNPGQHISISAGPAFQYFSMNKADNKNRFITYPYLNGLDSASLFENKAWLGGAVNVSIDNRNNKIIPGRGVNWQTTLRSFHGLNGVSHDYTQLSTDLSLFTSFSTTANVVIATRFGAGINFGNYEFFQAQFLSGTENLRGFRKYRFAGDKMAFNNTELRVKLGDFQTYLFPGSVGMLFFNDVGRVWTKANDGGGWHDGYGGGLWVSPLGKFVVTLSLTHSNEGTLPLLSFGFQF
ncbi:MAG TPA: BamA/TamA family outer membrane protein [Chitinophagaceae bacterium]|nr:BamA/TamA family outer membrane protein [Chitinophagaceae bacterium]